jgi:hypothetical protein
MEGSRTLAIFPVQALLTHSCLPNLQYIEKVNTADVSCFVFCFFKEIFFIWKEGGRKMVLQSVTNIEKGELLTVRYHTFPIVLKLPHAHIAYCPATLRVQFLLLDMCLAYKGGSP